MKGNFFQFPSQSNDNTYWTPPQVDWSGVKPTKITVVLGSQTNTPSLKNFNLVACGHPSTTTTQTTTQTTTSNKDKHLLFFLLLKYLNFRTKTLRQT